MEESTRMTRHWRGYGVFFGLGWLLFLAIFIANEATGRDPIGVRAWTIGAALLFAAIYVGFWVSVYMVGRPVPAAPVLVTLCAIATGLSLVSFDHWGGIFIYCGVAAGFGFEWRRATAAVLAVAVLAAAVGWAEHTAPFTPFIDASLAVLTGLSLISINRMVSAFQELRQAREELAELAVVEERLRFARDLHDLLGHSLSVIVLKSELAGRLGPSAPQQAEREVRDIERVAREALKEVREAVGGYRQAGLPRELDGARKALRAAGIEVTIQQAAGPLPAAVDSVLAWGVREGTTNVLRHSQASRVAINLSTGDDAALLEIVDNGLGGAVAGTGSGLRGLRERVEARQGSLQVGASPEGGFRLLVSLPLSRAPERAPAG